VPAVREELERRWDATVDGLSAFLRIPSISSDPARRDAMLACARWLAEACGHAGLEHAQVLDTAGHPAVYADWLHAAGAPTVLFYGHYDVQPPDPLELWQTPPFEPTVRDGTLYARGATDDKGQVSMHLAAAQALLGATGALPVNLKVLIEGEEEVGSPSLGALVTSRRKQLHCDAVLISDTTMYTEERPALCYGLRGLAYFEVEVEGANSDLHSGSYGGAVPNPLQALASLLAGLKDEHGRIAVPGFYDAVRADDPAERARIAALNHDDRAYCTALGLEAVSGEEGYNTLERTWIRPSLDINGIWGGYTGPGSKTVLPAHAGAKLSFRLVPDQEPEAIAALLRADLENRRPAGVRMRLTSLHGAQPWLTAPDHPYLQAAARALERAFGQQPVWMREGGSIPVVATFDAVLKVPVVLLGVGLHEDGAHAPNEHFSLARFRNGALATAYFLEGMSSAGTAARIG
jgi:acetylornithine deacetylase/succinyl-diaminopimelate desuccinylase-like protein